MAELQNVVGKFVGDHTRHPEIVGASLVDVLCAGCPVWWMSHIQTGQAQDLPLQPETIGGLGVE